MDTVVQTELMEITNIIAQILDVEKIYLFDSYAYGDYFALCA